MRTQRSRMELWFVFIRKQPVFQAFQSYPGLFFDDAVMMPYHMLGISIVSHVTTDNVIHQRIAYFSE